MFLERIYGRAAVDKTRSATTCLSILVTRLVLTPVLDCPNSRATCVTVIWRALVCAPSFAAAPKRRLNSSTLNLTSPCPAAQLVPVVYLNVPVFLGAPVQFVCHAFHTVPRTPAFSAMSLIVL